MASWPQGCSPLPPLFLPYPQCWRNPRITVQQRTLLYPILLAEQHVSVPEIWALLSFFAETGSCLVAVRLVWELSWSAGGRDNSLSTHHSHPSPPSRDTPGMLCVTMDIMTFYSKLNSVMVTNRWKMQTVFTSRGGRRFLERFDQRVKRLEWMLSFHCWVVQN